MHCNFGLVIIQKLSIVNIGVMMRVTCACESKLTFDVLGADAKLLDRAIASGQKMVMIQCQRCEMSVPFNTQTLTTPVVDPQNKYHCLVDGCDGLIVHFEIEESNHWGCGECGSVWDDEAEILLLGGKIVSLNK